MRAGIEPASSWMLVRFISTESQRELLQDFWSSIFLTFELDFLLFGCFTVQVSGQCNPHEGVILTGCLPPHLQWQEALVQHLKVLWGPSLFGLCLLKLHFLFVRLQVQEVHYKIYQPWIKSVLICFPHPRHVEVPGPGTEPSPQQWPCQVLNPLGHQGTPISCFPTYDNYVYNWKFVCTHTESKLLVLEGNKNWPLNAQLKNSKNVISKSDTELRVPGKKVVGLWTLISISSYDDVLGFFCFVLFCLAF